MGMWSDQARRVIRATLDGLPVGVTRERAVAALKEAYPFGPRAHHPYKVWCKECQAALDKAFVGRVAVLSREPPAARLVLEARPTRFWLDVRCDWCRAGCVVCLRLRARLPALVEDPEFCRLAAGDTDNPLARDVLLDFIEEHLSIRPEARYLPRDA